MDYSRHYDVLIERARTRKLTGYSERHHIQPRCLGGSDAKSNIVRLMPEEHYVAHQLLVKMHPRHMGLLGALCLMSGNTGHRRNKLYGWLRRRFALVISETQRGKIRGPLSEATRTKIGASQKGKFVSAETRANQSKAHKGKPLSAAQIAANARRRGIVTDAQLEALARGRANADYTKRGVAISEAKKGKPQSEAHKAALAAARKPRIYSDEERARMSAAAKGKPKSEETRRRMSEAAKRRDPSHYARDAGHSAKHSEVMKGIWERRRAGELPVPVKSPKCGRPRKAKPQGGVPSPQQ